MLDIPEELEEMLLEPLFIIHFLLSFRNYWNDLVLTKMYVECSVADAHAFPCFRSTGAPAGPTASGSNRRLQQTQNQVDEVLL